MTPGTPDHGSKKDRISPFSHSKNSNSSNGHEKEDFKNFSGGIFKNGTQDKSYGDLLTIGVKEDVCERSQNLNYGENDKRPWPSFHFCVPL